MAGNHPHGFDARAALTLDLASGRIRAGDDATMVVLPADALVAVCRAAGTGSTEGLGRALGRAMAGRVRGRLSTHDGARPGSNDPVPHAPFRVVVELLAGELAVAGLGALATERWGRALALAIDHSPVSHEPSGVALLASLLTEAISALSGSAAKVVPIERRASRARFVVVAEGVDREVLAAMALGTLAADVLQRLDGGQP